MKTQDQKYFDILLTDIQPHVAEPQNPKSPSEVIRKARKKNVPGRFFIKDFKLEKDGSFSCIILETEELKKLREQAHKEGKQLRIGFPKNMFMYASKDVLEYINARKKKAFNKASVLNRIKR